MQGAITSKKPTLFNRKLFPLFKRYITFTGSPIQLYTFLMLFITSPFFLIVFPNIIGAFFYLMLLTTIVIQNKYGVNEGYIISLFPVSKKQSVLVRCLHLLLIQTFLFGMIIGLSYIEPLSISENGLYFLNRQLAISILLISITYSNIIIIGFSFTWNKTKNVAKILTGGLSLFFLPIFLSILFQSNSYLLEHITNNHDLNSPILITSLVIFYFTTVISSIFAIKTCKLFETDNDQNKSKADKYSLSQSKPDGILLVFYLKLLRILGVNENTVKLVRKDCRMLLNTITLLVLLFIGLLNYIPLLRTAPLLAYSVVFATLLCILFVATGDLKISYFLPIKHTDYIKSKLILSFTLQSAIIFVMVAICLITYQFDALPIILYDEFKFSFFSSLFLAHALSNLVLFSLIFKYPYKIRTYLLTGIVYLFVVILFNALFTPSGLLIELASLCFSFAFYIIIMLLTYLIAKRKRGEV